MTARRHIIILALRRSGTTALWRLLRQDTSLTCFDEPFNMLLAGLPNEHRKQVRAEFITLFERDPARFRAMYAPIPRAEESTRGLGDAQRRYLQFLLSGGPVAIDVTRCHGKITALHDEMPDAVFVHLYRRASAFVTSHLLPSEGFDPAGLRSAWRRATFFRRARGYNRWGMEELTRHPYAGITRSLYADAGVTLPPDGSPAVRLLLAHWLGSWRVAERDGKAAYGERFLSWSFEDFCASPAASLAQLGRLADAPAFAFDLGGLRQPGAAHAADDPRWRAMAADAGFTPAEIERLL